MARSAKKHKVTNQANIDDIETVITSAIEAGTSLNPILDLVHLATSSADAVKTHKVIYALYRVFSLVLSSGKFPQSTDAAMVVKQWLNERLDEFVDLLCGLLKDNQKDLRSGSLQILMSLLKHLSANISASTGNPQIHLPHFRKIIYALLTCPSSVRPGCEVSSDGRTATDVRDLFLETWLNINDDIRWFFLRETATLLHSKAVVGSHVPDNILSFLERITSMPADSSDINSFWIPELARNPRASKGGKQDPISDNEDEDDWRAYFDTSDAPVTEVSASRGPRIHKLSTLESLHNLPSHQSQFTVCWLDLLPHLSTSASLSLRVLTVLHGRVIPHLNRPIRLMDWIGGCVDFGGAIGLLALNALFTLIRDHNLTSDYPNFYTRLYAFLTRDVFHLKYRARFFRLTELFLSSTHLPSKLLASFIKRLSRLSLSAPPAAIVMIIPFVYNILKRHPACMVMIHRDLENMDVDTDPFDANEPSPLLTNALSSSLWELSSHKNHYISSVSTLARIFSEVFTKPSYKMEDFLDHTYGTLFSTEVKRKIETDPATALRIKAGLFAMAIDRHEGENEVVTEPDDLVSALWHL